MTFTRAGLARQRYVAVFDILGFQDLITKKSLASVTDSYDMFEFLIVEMSRTAPKAVRRRLTQLFFQDTVLVYTNTAGQSDLEALLMYCSGLVGFGLAFDIRLRGAIARGKLFANKAGVLGRPLITAYRMSQEQEWVGCWVHDRCVPRSKQARALLVRYPIPLKGGPLRSVAALNWPADIAERVPDMLSEGWRLLVARRPKSWEVERKVRNADTFIRHCLHGSGIDRMGRHSFPAPHWLETPR
jgi:hypothetical protein